LEEDMICATHDSLGGLMASNLSSHEPAILTREQTRFTEMRKTQRQKVKYINIILGSPRHLAFREEHLSPPWDTGPMNCIVLLGMACRTWGRKASEEEGSNNDEGNKQSRVW